MDGDMGHSQMDLWEELCTVASDIAVFDQQRVLYLTTRFRDFDCLVSTLLTTVPVIPAVISDRLPVTTDRQGPS